MTETQAREALERVRAPHAIGAELALTKLERLYIQVGDAPAEVPGEAWDVLAWVGRFAKGARWVEVALDDATGAVLRVQWSRSAGRPRGKVDR